MNIIYIAGPYRADTEWQLIENIRAAEAAAIKLWAGGWAVICPHKNTAHFGGVWDIPDDTWLEGDLEILNRCDAIYMLKGWTKSEGSKMEHLLAVNKGMKIIYE